MSIIVISSSSDSSSITVTLQLSFTFSSVFIIYSLSCLVLHGCFMNHVHLLIWLMCGPAEFQWTRGCRENTQKKMVGLTAGSTMETL